MPEQIKLDDEKIRQIKQATGREDLSEAVSVALDEFLADHPVPPRPIGRDSPLLKMVGVGKGPPDGARNHDLYIYGPEK